MGECRKITLSAEGKRRPLLFLRTHDALCDAKALDGYERILQVPLLRRVPDRIGQGLPWAYLLP